MDKSPNNSRIIFFGGRHVHSVATSLNENFDLSLVITTDKSMADLCRNENIPFTHTLSLTNEIISEIKKLNPIVGIVADFGIIIPSDIIDLFPHGIINIHPSLLPLYRGPTPVPTAIINGDEKTGITIIKIDEKMDHGPILYQEEREIKQTDYSEELLLELFDRSSEFLPDIVKHYVEGSIELTTQDDSIATYTKEFTKEDGFVDINNPPSKEDLSLMIRGFNLWPGVWTKYNLNDKELIIKLFPDKKIQVEGKKIMSFKDFMNGYDKGEEFLKKLNLI